MQQPISVGWVLLKLFETVWRLLLLITVAAAAIAGYVWSAQQSPLSSKIAIEIEPSSTGCADPARPVRVAIVNRSKKIVGEVQIELRVYERGKSENVIASNSRYVTLNDILKPKHWNQYCFAVPETEVGAEPPFSIVGKVEYATELAEGIPVPPDAPPPIIYELPPNGN